MKIKKIKKVTEAEVLRLIIATSPWTEFGFTKKHAKNFAINFSNRVNLGAFDGKKLVGVASYTYNFLGGAYLNILTVDRDYRGQQVGEKLVMAMEHEVFKVKKCKNLYLCVSSFNRRAQKFYRDIGYVKIGVIKKMIVKRHDEFLFRKTLGPIRG